MVAKLPTLGMLDMFWVGKLRDYMKHRFPTLSPSQLNITWETVKTLHNAYLAALAKGAKRFEYISQPGKDFPGTPTKETSLTIVNIGKTTGLGTQLSGVFADGLTYMFNRGEVGQSEFDPATKQAQTAATTTAFPEKKSATAGIMESLTTATKTAGVAVPALLVGTATLLFLIYVPRPRR